MPRRSNIAVLTLRLARVLSFWVCGGMVFSEAAFGGEPAPAFASVRLKDGREFAAVHVVNYTRDGILVRHAGGATTFRLRDLPAAVLSALPVTVGKELPPEFDPRLADLAAVDETTPSAIADQPARADTPWSELADRPAIDERSERVAWAEFADAAAVAPDGARASDDDAPRSVAGSPGPLDDAMAEVVATATEEDPTSLSGPAPAGEGNIPAFFIGQAAIPAAMSRQTDLAGRIVVAGANGDQHFLGDVEVYGYPSEILVAALPEARARAAAAAERLRRQASDASRAGRATDARSLSDRANQVAARLVDYLPVAPISTRTDKFGNFTLRHDLPDLVLVAASDMSGHNGTWHYEWVGIRPDGNVHLTEANATAIMVVAATSATYASR